jgi:Zn-dependent protease
MYEWELRLHMQWNSDESSEYGKTTKELNYIDPAYYQKDSAYPAYVPQPEKQSSPYSSYIPYEDSSTPGDRYSSEPLVAYRGPSDLKAYTTDTANGQMQVEGDEQEQVGGKKKRKGIAGLGGIGAAIAALLKIQWVVYFLKFGFAGISAVISIFAYSWIFGWPFAIGLVALLFIHEMGHAVVMKMKGIPVGGLIFIPLLGAAVFMRQMPKNAKDEAEVGIAGPIAGALASSFCLLLALHFSQSYTYVPMSNIWAPLAYFGFFINLFNLIPIVPFDGGRVLAAIDRRIWILGFLGLIGFEVWSWLNGSFSIWLLFFIVMAGSQFLARRKVPDTAEGRAYYTVPVVERIILSIVYFGLAAVLILGMSISHGMMFTAG